MSETTWKIHGDSQDTARGQTSHQTPRDKQQLLNEISDRKYLVETSR